MSSPLKYFAELKDPRLPRTRRHLLPDILLIAIASILSGAAGWDDMERYGKAKRDWLKSFLALPHGIPSHDTFNRVFQALDPAELEKNFLDWVGAIAERTRGEVVAIDGKSLRGTAGSEGKPIVHMVSAWASANNLVLGQRKTDAKSNEITAIPELLRVLELSGTTVTIDAMGCQKSIASQIVEQDGDCILADRLRTWARGNPPLLGAGRSEPDRQHRKLGLAAGRCAHPSHTLPQGYRQAGTRDTLLHHQP